MKTLFLFLGISFGLNHAVQLKRKVVPEELRRFLTNVTSLDSFVQAMSIERMVRLRGAVKDLNKEGKGRTRTKHVTRCSVVHQRTNCTQNGGKDLCTKHSSCPIGLCCFTGCIKECVFDSGRLLAELSKISKFPHLPYVIPDHASCAPRPVVVEVQQPVHESTLYFPFFVTMYRCGGNCNVRDDTICRPLVKEDVNIVVGKITWSSVVDKLEDISRTLAVVAMTNHTSCSCQCQVKPTDCDNRTQEYSEKYCSCQCKKPNTSCPSKFRWDPTKCQCVCDRAKVASKCTKRFQLDEKTCQCTCRKTRCSKKQEQAGKVIDPKTCLCRCSPIKCPTGTTLDRRLCTCVGRSRRKHWLGRPSSLQPAE